MSQTPSTHFFIIDDKYAVWYEKLGDAGCQAHIILIEDIPEHAHVIDVKEEKK